MYIYRVSPYIKNGCLNRYIIGKVTCLLFRVVVRPIRVFIILLQYTCNLSMSARQSRKGVSAFTIQKSTRLIRVLTLTNLINAVKLMPNQTFTALVCVILMSVLSFIVVLYVKYCLQPAVNFLDVLVLIITLQNSLGVQYSVVIYVNRSCLQSVTSIVGIVGIFIDWFLGIIKCIKEQSANTVIILKVQLSVRGLKVVRNIFKVFYS